MTASDSASTAADPDAPGVAIAIMAKLPEVGRTKTRLSPPLAPHEAVELYEALLRDTIRLVASLQRVRLVLAVTPVSALDYFTQLAPDALLVPVEGEDIGECLNQVLSRLLDRGYHAAFAIDSDGPSLPRAYLQEAMRCIREADMVLGPSDDGGYYLIGLKASCPGLFRGVSWSTGRVAAQTLARAAATGLRVGLLPSWYDVDTAADLARLQSELRSLPDDRLLHTRRLGWIERINRP